MKLFETRFQFGSYIDRISGTAGTPAAAPFTKLEKGLCVDLNGSSSQIEYLTGAISLVNGYSINAWVRSTGIAIGQIVSVDDANASERVFQFRFDADGKIRFVNFNSVDVLMANFTTTNTWNDGLWHNVLVTFDPATGSNIYIDGVLDGTDATTGTPKSI